MAKPLRGSKETLYMVLACLALGGEVLYAGNQTTLSIRLVKNRILFISNPPGISSVDTTGHTTGDLITAPNDLCLYDSSTDGYDISTSGILENASKSLTLPYTILFTPFEGTESEIIPNGDPLVPLTVATSTYTSVINPICLSKMSQFKFKILQSDALVNQENYSGSIVFTLSML